MFADLRVRATRMREGKGRRILLAPASVALTAAVISGCAPAQCTTTAANEIVAENCREGSLQTEWDVEGAGDPSIQGFAADMSVDQGQTVQFKVKTEATNYRLDIYRMGYYFHRGARKVATIEPSAALPQAQPDCLREGASGLVDCGNWGVSASWTAPAGAVSGVYFAKLVREDVASGGSHVFFVVRDDDGASDLLLQTSDTTWQAYNSYGGNSLYTGGPGTSPGRAHKASYNRPFNTRAVAPEDWVFNAEYPMIRHLERNGYDVSYTTGVDSDRRGPELPHRYRISWTGTTVEFFVDGTSVATHPVAIGGDMRPLGSDFNVGGGAATWHWVRMSPYAAAGTFTSRVLDSGAAGSDWTALALETSEPAGAQASFETRSGDSATPGAGWSPWQPLGGLGSIASPDARHLQYRVALTTSDTARTPAVERVTVRYRPASGP